MLFCPKKQLGDFFVSHRQGNNPGGFLIQQGIDVTLKDSKGNNALHLSCYCESANPDLIKLLTTRIDVCPCCA